MKQESGEQRGGGRVTSFAKWVLRLIGLAGLAGLATLFAYGMSAFQRGSRLTISDWASTLEAFDVYVLSASIVVGLTFIGYELHRAYSQQSDVRTQLQKRLLKVASIVGGVVLLFFSGLGIHNFIETRLLPGIADTPTPSVTPTTSMSRTPTPSITPTASDTSTATPTPSISPSASLTPTPTPISECDRENPVPPCLWSVQSGDSYGSIALAVYSDDSYALVIMTFNRTPDGYRRVLDGFLELPGETEFEFSDVKSPVFPANRYPTCTEIGAKPCLYEPQPTERYPDIAQRFYGFETAAECIRAANLTYNQQGTMFLFLDEEDMQGKTLVLPRYSSQYCTR